MSTIKADTIQNSTGGAATLTGHYTPKAWVKFNGTGTVAINSSGNVSSITDVTTGRYSVNYSNSVTHALHSSTMSSVAVGYVMQANCTPRTGANTTTTSCSVATGNSINGSFADHDNINVVCLA